MHVVFSTRRDTLHCRGVFSSLFRQGFFVVSSSSSFSPSKSCTLKILHYRSHLSSHTTFLHATYNCFFKKPGTARNGETFQTPNHDLRKILSLKRISYLLTVALGKVMGRSSWFLGWNSRESWRKSLKFTVVYICQFLHTRDGEIQRSGYVTRLTIGDLRGS